MALFAYPTFGRGKYNWTETVVLIKRQKALRHERNKPRSKSLHRTPAATSMISIKLMFILLDNFLLPTLHLAIFDVLPPTAMSKIGHLLS